MGQLWLRNYYGQLPIKRLVVWFLALDVIKPLIYLNACHLWWNFSGYAHGLNRAKESAVWMCFNLYSVYYNALICRRFPDLEYDRRANEATVLLRMSQWVNMTWTVTRLWEVNKIRNAAYTGKDKSWVKREVPGICCLGGKQTAGGDWAVKGFLIFSEN